MTKIILVGFAVFALAGCSSAPKPVAERVKDTEKSMVKTDELLSQAQEEMNSFTRRLSELKEEGGENIPMARRARFDSSLDRLQLAIQQSQFDLKDLQTNNLEKKKAFETRMNRAIDPASGASEPVYEAD